MPAPATIRSTFCARYCMYPFKFMNHDVMRKVALLSVDLMRLNITRIQALHSIVSCQCSRQSCGLDRCNA